MSEVTISNGDVVNTIVNKKMGRHAVYMRNGEVHLFHMGDFVATVNRADAHDWMHGKEHQESPPEIAPTIDDMIDVVGDKLKAEMAWLMTWALDHPDGLQGMYNAARRGASLTRPAW